MEEKKKWYANKKVLVILIAVLVVAIVGMSFAYYFAILRGDNVNIAKTGGASLIYTEPSEDIEISQMSDYDGMTNTKSYDFSVTGRSDGDASLYYGIYAEEEEGNTIDASNVKVYLTDEKDIPYYSYVDYLYNYGGGDDGKTILLNSDGKFVSSIVDEEYFNPVLSGVDYTIDYNYDGEHGSVTGRDFTIEDALLNTYASKVLKLFEGEKFYVTSTNKDGEKICVEHVYDISRTSYYEEGSVFFGYDIGDLSIVDSSLCNVSFVTYDNYHTALIDDDENVIVKETSKDYNVKINNQEYESIDNFLESKLGSSEYYLRIVYALRSNMMESEFYDAPSYCINSEGDIVDDSMCENAYQKVVGIARPKILSETLSSFDYYTGDDTLTNHIVYGQMHFAEGELTYFKGMAEDYDHYYENPRQYKLRHWISNDGASEENSDVPQESTTTSEGNTHTVEFGSGGVFKFKVNVYARQG